MDKNFIIDCLSCILFRLFAPLTKILPRDFILFLGRRLGDLFYAFDFKHKAVAYANIKCAFSDKLLPSWISGLTKDFYRALGQNIVEMLMIPLVDKKYIDKYISFEGLNYISEGLKRGKGVILLAVHEGSWELSNIICANLGFPFVLFVRDQGYPRLNRLLNSYRLQKGCQIIERENGLRQLIEALKNNQAIGMTADQGGKTGILVKFFGKDASMPTGAVKLALKYDATLIPVFYTRLEGQKIKVIIEPPFKLKRVGNPQQDTRDNLQEIIHIFEKNIIKYPKEYLWTYKIWKYGQEKNILILSDAKTGHLRQSQALANIISNYLKSKDVRTDIKTIEVKFRNELSKQALILSSGLAGKYHCQGCLWCLKTFLKKDNYRSLIAIKPDIVISCGSSVAPVNFVISRENLARSIVVMRPSFLSTRRFDLVIMPRHDNPPRRKNIVATEAALNLISEEYLRGQSKEIIQACGLRLQPSGLYIGLLIGGDTKNFSLNKDTILEVIRQTKSVAEKLNANILATTSRRTSKEIEELLKAEFKNYARCKLIVIANERNIPGAVGGILGLSQFVITSPESISMISEAASSKKYVLVFKSEGLSVRHKRFLNYFVKNKYIYLIEAHGLSRDIQGIWSGKPQINNPRDILLVQEAIKKIL